MADMTAQDAKRFDANVLRAFTTECLTACALPARDAAQVAGMMIDADLAGADAHGIFRLPQYVRRLNAGGVNPTPSIDVRKTAAATAIVDGDNGMGHLVMHRAVETAIELAGEAGVGWVGVRRSNHAGPASLYATMPMERGMIGIYSAVASANHMAIWGGSEPLLGTNPLAIGIPAGEFAPVVLDIATTMVSYGTIKSYALNGLELPKGWLIERTTGQPLTDPKRSSAGLLVPIGGYKGSGLALVLGILAGVLNGAAFGRDVIDFNADSSSETNTGHFILAIDVKRFQPLAAFQGELDRQLASLQASQTMPGFETIRLPGAERLRRVAERSRNGVPISAGLETALDKLAVDLNLGALSGRT
ncbi:Ldh family oxidoreductase [Mesorhizobium sp. CN2-181]|uniref:Ldh family oxidoreductase n=1 Tax=Mesorhizobium yinganensis TaxID=3157707 RepID=UPI0032B75D71